MLDAKKMVGTHDVLMVVLDTLRYDVAQQELQAGRTPNLQRLIGADGWELRHTPASFTFPAHQAFFAGFLPTPARPGPHHRLLAVNFAGSETIGDRTCTFDAENIVEGLEARGYHTLCIGGVGFFNEKTPLSRVLPRLFAERKWCEAFGVTDRQSTENQVAFAIERMRSVDDSQPLFLFMNVSALHQPNYFYLDGAKDDDVHSHAAALRYVDHALAPLFSNLRRSTLCIVTSDHGTTYGDDGFRGHRLAHPAVWNVPYAEFVVEGGTTS